MKTINQALGSVVRLEHHGGLATAFFYRNSSDELYLVTNKHVIRAEDSAYSPKILYAHCPLRTSRDKSRYNTKRIRIELYQRKNKGIKWKTPQDPKIDMAALKIEEEKLEGCSITSLSSKDTLSPGNYPALGSTLLVLGFPGLKGTQFYDVFSNLPIVRSSSVATLPFLTFTSPNLEIYKERYFLVDGILGPGMSGSPVVSLQKSILIKDGTPVFNDVNSYLVGILSSGSSQLELHTIWLADLIEDATH